MYFYGSIPYHLPGLQLPDMTSQNLKLKCLPYLCTESSRVWYQTERFNECHGLPIIVKSLMR